MRVRYRRASVLATVLALTVVAACGQKPGVSQLYAGPGALPGQVPGAQGTIGADGQPVDPGTGTAADGTAGATGSDGTVGPGGTANAPGGSKARGPGGSAPLPPGAPAPGPGDKNGVTASEIHIGLHAPVTGAAAFPQRSFQNAVGVYANYINGKGGINGRKLVMHFEDDAFNPNTAVGKCKKFAQQIKVFAIIGGAGSDQIDACARYSNAAGVPYLSAGVHETRPSGGSLNSLSTYYAASLTYEQQAPMIAKQMKASHSGQKVALLVADNDSLNNYFSVQKAALERTLGKSNLVLARRVPKNIQSDAPTIATQLCNSGAKAAVWNAAPSGFINVTKSMTCDVRFFGPGNTNGINIVATGGCPKINGARFFSSFPQLDKINQLDPAYDPAYRKKNGSAPDDIGIAIWGIEKLLGQMLQATGKDLGRARFMATLNSGKTFNNGVYPPVKFGANKRFGGSAMHLLEAQCGSNPRYITKGLNIRP